VDVDTLRNWRFPEISRAHSEADAMLYALAIGLGSDPTDSRQLRYVYEKALQVFPTMATVLAHPGFWMADPEFGIDATAVLHGEQALTMHGVIPTSGLVVGRLEIDDVIDKGAKGAFVYSTRTISDAATGELLATLASTTICRNDGGFGGSSQRPGRGGVAHDGPPDLVCTLPTFPNSALLYRLTGDRNPLHADPEVAGRAGFDAPILHGLCTFGVAAHAIVRTVCEYDATRLRHIEVRFSAPVTPGTPIVTRLWNHGDRWSFECSAGESGPVVLTAGQAIVG